MIPWLIWVMGKVDMLLGLSKGCLILTGILFLIFGVLFPMLQDLDVIKSLKQFKGFIWVPIISALILITVPDRDTIILMWVIPKLSNSEMVKKDFPELYDKAIKIISNEIDKKLNGDKK